jgi:two-component system cell cycle sensor histidine kinase/response regulator CckA
VLPGWTGLDALHHLRAAGDSTPFLLVTGVLDEAAAAECIKLGINDYILKDRLARLPVALNRVLEDKKLRDASAQVRSALEESEARAAELLEHSIYGVFRASLDGTFFSANPSFLEILACSSLDELKTINLVSDVFRYFEEFVPLLASCREHGLVHNVESEWRRKDGGLRSVRLSFRYLSLPGPADAIEDVTELRLLERQLQQAQKFESIGQLAGGIAHDFNNVIGAILGWAELGFEECSTLPKIAERFSKIREQADRAASLTRELLAFARRQSLQSRAIDLNAVNRGLTSFLEKVISKDIEIKFNPGVLHPIKADPTQIEQVLMNLCLNARDAMPNGGRLLIETEMVPIDDSYCHFYPYFIPGLYAVLSVSDTGVGMEPEVRERIFEPFFTTKENGKGTGMGLATAYGIVKQHGGFIHVYSEPRHGTLFRVYLPAMEAAAAESSPLDHDSPPTSPLHGSETILLAEDHDSIREMVRQSLVNYGYRVLSAEDGEQALRLCERETPDLAILDLVMPHLGGPATALRLRDRFPRLHVLFTSGYSESSAGALAQVPYSRYLQKPYSPTSLGRILREILGPSRTPDLFSASSPECRRALDV